MFQKVFRIGFVLCTVLLCCPAVSSGQRYLFANASSGLGDLNINALAQDNAGFLWVGTDNGLYRFDGFHYQRFGPEAGIAESKIQNLFLAPDGTMWVGSTAGIYFSRRDGNFAQLRSPDLLSRFPTRPSDSFAATPQNQILLAARNGIFLLQNTAPDQWTATPFALTGHPIASVYSDAHGALWSGCETDLCLTANGSTRQLRDAFHLPEEQWLRIRPGPQGHLWLRGRHHLVELDPINGRWEARDFPHSSEDEFLAMALSSHGQIVAAEQAGLGIWQGDHWQLITAANGLEQYAISTLFCDRQGGLWIGQLGHGLKHWIGQDLWEALTADGLGSNHVYATLRDRSGRLWIGTESGLHWIDPYQNTLQLWKLPGVASEHVRTLLEAADGALWMGSANGQVVRIDPITLRGAVWKIPEVHRIVADAQHRVWIATSSGLYLATGPAAGPVLAEGRGIAPIRQRFTDLSLSPAGTLWAAGEHHIYRLNGDRWQVIDAGLTQNDGRRLAADGLGNLWAAGDGPGLLRLRIADNRIQETERIQNPPLLSERILSILVDHRGWLWFGQDRGLTAFNGKSWHSFTEQDGLAGNTCSPSGLREDPDGSLWIATSSGLAHLLSPELLLAAERPSLALSQAHLRSEDASHGSALHWNGGPLTLSFADLDFSQPRPARIRYRLLGFESAWKTSLDATASYAKLPPGEYQLEAIGEDANGSALTPTLNLAFHILPRWWQNPFWLWALAFGLLLAAAALGWKWKRAHRKRKQPPQTNLRKKHEQLEQERMASQLARDQLRLMAEYDDLTGLWNHRSILERLSGELERSQRHGIAISILLIELDHFRKINAHFGHPIGDRVLQEIGRILLRAVRSYDWVGRFRGAEYLVILPGSDSTAALARAESLRKIIQTPRRFDATTEIQVTASFGIASTRKASCEQLILAAIKALRRAQEEGHNRSANQEVEILEDRNDVRAESARP